MKPDYTFAMTKRILPSKTLAPVEFKLHGLKRGKYKLSIYKTGYHANDPYSAYFAMGSPSQLTVQQVQILKQKDNDNPVEEKTITVGTSGSFEQQLAISQNDVLLVKFNRID